MNPASISPYPGSSSETSYPGQNGSRPPKPFDPLFRLLAKWASGADPDLIAQLPQKDLASYIGYGFVNLVFAAGVGVAVGQIMSVLAEVPDPLSCYVAGTVAFLLLAPILRFLNRLRINREEDMPIAVSTISMTRFRIDYYSILCVFMAILVGIGQLLYSGNKNRLSETKALLPVFNSLDSLQNSIRELHPELIFSEYEVANNDTIRNLSAYKAAVNRTFSAYRSFADLNLNNTSILATGDTAGVYQTAYTLKSVIESNYYQAYQATLLNEGKKAVENLQTINPSTYNRITQIYNPSSFFSLKTGVKLSLVLNNADFLSWLTLVSWMLALLSMIVYQQLTLRQNRHDLYHVLLTEKQRLQWEFLELQRTQITADYRIRTELKNISTQLQNDLPFADEPDKETITSYHEKLNEALSPQGLLAAATIACNRKEYQKSLEYLNKAIELENGLLQENKQYRQTPEIYELKSMVLGYLSLKDDAVVAETKGREIREENAFLENKSKVILLEKLEIQNISIFDNFSWIFKPGINILLGKNGYGKSHLLGLIISLLYDDKRKIKDWISGSQANACASLYLSGEVPGREQEAALFEKTKTLREMQMKLDEDMKKVMATAQVPVTEDDLSAQFKQPLEAISLLNDEVGKLQLTFAAFRPSIKADTNTIKSLTGRIPVLAISDSRFIDKSGDSVKASNSQFSDLARYGAHEFLYSLPYMDVIENVLFKTCIDYFEQRKTFADQPFQLIREVIKDLSADKLVVRNGQLQYQDDSRFRFISIKSNDKNASFSINVQPEDANLELPLQKISQGTFSMVAICCLIYQFLSALPQAETEVLHRRAIVIIDELDAHIHPSWQRKLVAILKKNFPHVQFIISAHSPLMVEGCKANEVSVLRRTSEGKFRIETISRSLIGYPAEKINSVIFEVENKDPDLLRYTELSPYIDSFKNELLRLKERNEREELATEDINRIAELQDLIEHIDLATTAMEKQEMEKKQESMNISNFLKSAIETPPLP